MSEVASAIHHKLIKKFKEYMIIGGMPAIVNEWTQQQNLNTISQIQQDLLATYQDDFSKYSGKLEIAHLHEVLQATPTMLGEKFVYRKVNADIASSVIKQAIQLLTTARLCHKVNCVSGNGIPLAAETKDKFFKLILLATPSKRCFS